MLESFVLAVRKEKTRCWDSRSLYCRKEKLDAAMLEALYWQFGKKKLDARKLGNGIRREKTSTGSLVLTMWTEKNRCLELGLGTSERKNQMLGSLVLAV
jgi:hypothetical protein